MARQVLRTVGIFMVLCSGFMTLSSAAFAMMQVGKYKTHELVFASATSPANPFDTYLLKLEITDPVGTTFTIEGFFDGDGNGGQTGNIWKARVAPYMTGTWSWRTVAGDAPDTGLAGLSGQFNVAESGDKGGIIADGQHFRFQDGDFVYLQGHFLDNRNVGPPLNTSISTHVYMAETAVDDADRAQILSTQVNDHAVNKINIYYSNDCDYRGQEVNPWQGTYPSPDKTQMNLARWKLYDGYIESFKDNGMHASMWGFSDCYSGSAPSVTDLQRLFRYAMARHSAYNHTSFTLGLEYKEQYTAAGMNTLGNFIVTKNPWKRLLSVHHLQNCGYDFAGEAWIDYASAQSGFSGSPSTVNSCAISLHNTKEPNKPGLDEEFWHDKMAGGEPVGRNLTWANFTGSAAGGGTGAGIRAFMRFLEISKIPHQRMTHSNGAVSSGGSTRFALSETNSHHLVYTLNGSAFNFTVTGSGLTGYWYNPRQAGTDLQLIGAINSGAQQFTPPTSGSSDDWVLWITDGTNLNSGLLYVSPGATPTREIINGSPRPAPPTNLQVN